MCGSCVAICKNHNIANNEAGDIIHEINRSDCSVCGKCVEACFKSALEIKGKEMTTDAVMKIILKDKRYYEQSGGGLTLSGGEPLAQFDFSLELLKTAKENNIHTCIETSGYIDRDRLAAILPHIDLFLYDYKESDDEKHKSFTGASNRQIIDNLFFLDKTGKKIILRCPIIPGFNDCIGHFTAIAETASRLDNIVEINIMPYHPMGLSKAKRIGKQSFLSDIGFPNDEQIEGWVQSIGRLTTIPVKKNR
jgi:pyruvate formate lyase activating enzyme